MGWTIDRVDANEITVGETILIGWPVIEASGADAIVGDSAEVIAVAVDADGDVTITIAAPGDRVIVATVPADTEIDTVTR